jgi:hypothetical protein
MNSGKSLGRQAISMSISARLITPPCCLTPWRFFVDKVQRHMNPQLAVGADPQEVEMQNRRLEGVALQVAQHGAFGAVAQFRVSTWE